MERQRLQGAQYQMPFPVYRGCEERLLAAQLRGEDEHDAVLAHVLATFAGYAYADAGTMVQMAANMGLAACNCVRIAQTVDAMYIHSTAYLLQSRCGRVAILCYRGTEAATLGNWIADADIGMQAIRLAPGKDGLVRVHEGFHRNMRATRWAVLEELELALAGRSLADPMRTVEHGLQALFVAGHSFGGALATLFALSLGADPQARQIIARLRAVYTYGQPLVVGGSLPPSATWVERQLWRYVSQDDPVPALPPSSWGRLVHIGRECRWQPDVDGGAWQPSAAAVEQAGRLGSIGGWLRSLPGSEKVHANWRHAFGEHPPHRYIDRLRPPGVLTEYGELEAPPGWHDGR